MRWGLFGGTFDPVHLGHLRCAEEVRELFALDRIVFVPAARPPHKAEADISPFPRRERMLRLATEGMPSFAVSAVEGRREGASYSIDTVDEFRRRGETEPELFYILGQDAFGAIMTWKEWERLLLSCHFVVMTRPGYEARGLRGMISEGFAERFVSEDDGQTYRGPTGRRIHFCRVTYLEISASDIRRRVREGKSIACLVTGPVRDYILREGLYRKRPEA